MSPCMFPVEIIAYRTHLVNVRIGAAEVALGWSYPPFKNAKVKILLKFLSMWQLSFDSTSTSCPSCEDRVCPVVPPTRPHCNTIKLNRFAVKVILSNIDFNCLFIGEVAHGVLSRQGLIEYRNDWKHSKWLCWRGKLEWPFVNQIASAWQCKHIVNITYFPVL